ncbi:MAG: hypothetical protein ACRD96_00380, partial [Bryobacteraceae bacterium]
SRRRRNGRSLPRSRPADFLPVSPGFNTFPYAVAENGKRFLARVSAGDTAPAPLTVLVNWK